MKRGIRLAFVLVLTGIGLSACVTYGTKFDMAEVQNFAPGVTTRADAVARLGAPNSVTNLADGSVILVWMYCIRPVNPALSG